MTSPDSRSLELLLRPSLSFSCLPIGDLSLPTASERYIFLDVELAPLESGNDSVSTRRLSSVENDGEQ